jgi:hypothetical protein
MAIKITEIFVSLGLSSASFTKGMNDMKKLAFGSAKEIERSFKIIGVAVAGASAAAAAGLAALVKHQINVADGLHKLSQRTGIAVETLSGLAHAAKLSDVSTEQLGKGLQFLAKWMVANQRGGEDIKTVFFEMAERFSKTADGAQKTAAAMKVFGVAGAEMIPLLNQGRAELEAAWQEAEKLGLIIDSKTAAAAERFNDNLTRLQGVLVGFANQIMTENVGSLTLLSNWFLNTGIAAEKAGEDITAGFLNKFLIGVFAARGALEDFLSMLGESTGLGEPVVDAGGLGLEARIQQAVQQIQILNQEISDLGSAGGPRAAESLGDLAAGSEKAAKKQATLEQMLAGTNLALEKMAFAARKASLEMEKDLFRTPPDVGPLGLPTAEEQRETMEFLSKLPGAISLQLPPLQAVNELWFEMKQHLQGITFNALMDLGRQVAGLGTSWKQFFRNVLGDLAQMVWYLLVVKPLMGAIFGGQQSGGGGGGGFSWGGLFSGILGGLGGLFGLGGGIGQVSATPPYVPPRQFGGPVTAGRAYLVGEGGPELFVPRVGGEVVAGGRGRGAGGDTYIDARGADANVEFRVARALRAAEDRGAMKSIFLHRELAMRRA